jgi:hypothetical protein
MGEEQKIIDRQLPYKKNRGKPCRDVRCQSKTNRHNW